jgi:hypothetical protein
MAQGGAGAARQHRRLPAALVGEPRVADGVDPAVKAMKAAGPNAACDCRLGEANLAQLLERHDAVLVAREPGKHLLPGGGALQSHTD